MGRSRYSIRKQQAPHFLTCTVINWMPLFTRPQTVNIVINALKYRQENHGWKIYGYVILENHLHVIVQAENLISELPRFKSYTARQLIDYLKDCRAERMLKQMAFFRKAHKQDREYQCWEEGSHPQLIQNEQMMRQKLDYIHFNPVKRGYVDEPCPIGDTPVRETMRDRPGCFRFIRIGFDNGLARRAWTTFPRGAWERGCVNLRL